MAVAEVSVVIHLEPGAHGMVGNSKGIDNAVGNLYFFPEEAVKAILVHAFF